MSIQTYRDITFAFGPPSGDRYEMVKSTAIRQGETFSAMYREYMDGVFKSMEEDGLLDVPDHVLPEFICTTIPSSQGSLLTAPHQ